MKVAQVKENKIIVSEIDDIKLDGRKGAIVMTLGCGLCGSDIVKFRHKIVHDGAVLGHEIVAEILEINSDTKFKKGDRIVTSHHIPCGECNFCRHGNVSMCEHFKKTNIFPGGFSEKVFVSEEHLQNVAYLVPENMTDEEISFYEPLGCCIRAIKRCALQKDDTALIVGLGSIGLLMGEGLKAMGYKVYGCDLIPERIELAKKMGIEPFDFSFEVDGVFMTSGADKAIDTIANAIQRVSTQRSALGAVQNRLEHTINNLDNVVENTTSAESAIRDTDMATEMVKYSNNNILAQAGQAMLAQSNQANQGVLSLLPVSYTHLTLPTKLEV